jgi:hypothetical protein
MRVASQSERSFRRGRDLYDDLPALPTGYSPPAEARKMQPLIQVRKQLWKWR